MKRIGILNGPNLDRLGKREPEVYGKETLATLESQLKELGKKLNVEPILFQSNAESSLIEQIHAWTDEGIDGLIANFGSLTHTSIGLRDAIAASELPLVEVHISNIYKRESFRHHSYISDIANAVICGLGFQGYHAALRFLADLK